MPVEVLLHIFSFLPVCDVARASRICLQWNTLLHDDKLWKKWLQRDFPSYAVPSLTSSGGLATQTSSQLTSIKQLSWQGYYRVHRNWLRKGTRYKKVPIRSNPSSVRCIA